MPISLPEDLSIEALLEYVWSVDAALCAYDATAHLAAKWQTFEGVCLKERDRRDAARQKTARASARVRVYDTAFDTQVVTISGTAHLAAGRDENAEPYRSLFGAVTAREAQAFGPHKATTFGEDLLANAVKLAHVALAPLLPPFRELLGRLSKAAEEREEARRAEGLHDIDRARLVDQAERLAAETEIALLKTFLGQPGAKEIVRSIVGYQRPGTKKRAEEPAAPAPTA